jgi:enoyl-CoA hydratase/carnithine racemase
MSFAYFKFDSSTYSIEIIGSSINFESLKRLSKILLDICNNNKIKEVNIKGNFNTSFFLKDLNSNKYDLNEALKLFQLITKIIENSDITFISNLNNLVQGPTLELALSCDIVRAEKNTIFKFNEVDNGLMPFFGSIQRLSRIIGYKNTLETLLIKKHLSYEEALNFKIIHHAQDVSKNISKVKLLWDQSFTNTFIFYNSKIHSITKNKLPAHKAILSSIYEGVICDYEASLSIEKRWLKWLLIHNYTVKNILL